MIDNERSGLARARRLVKFCVLNLHKRLDRIRSEQRSIQQGKVTGKAARLLCRRHRLDLRDIAMQHRVLLDVQRAQANMD